MSIQRLTPPGTNAELAALTPAPVEHDRGFLIRSIAASLLESDEPEFIAIGALSPAEITSQELIDTTLEAPRGSAEEVVRAHLDGLPAAQFRLIDPRKHKIIPVLNGKGLIDDKAFIAQVLETIDPSFHWLGKPDRHHLCWPRANYVEAQKSSGVPAYIFREHGSNVIRVQRVFHNWIHAVSETPPMPDPEVMRYTLRAWEVVGDFFMAARQTVSHQRLFAREELRRGGYNEEQQEMVREALLRELGGILMHLDALQNIPEDYWPFRPDIKVQIAAGQVGQVLTKGYLNRTREVRLARVA
ncbi:hypothetical protein H7Y63_02360 [Polaromonas sp.]|nr:hypothetical protein [Candidatus Saccharibacteria bacterium]